MAKWLIILPQPLLYWKIPSEDYLTIICLLFRLIGHFVVFLMPMKLVFIRLY